APLPDLHSFPTRRSSDLERVETYRSHTGRLTWQASQKNKVTFFTDIQDNCLCRSIYGGFAAPEAVLNFTFWPTALVQGTWSSARSEEHTSELQSLAYLVC